MGKQLRNGLIMIDKKNKKNAKQTVVREPGRPKRHDLEEIKNMEEPIYLPTKSKPKGRPKNENYISLAEAREFIRGEMIPSPIPIVTGKQIGRAHV